MLYGSMTLDGSMMLDGSHVIRTERLDLHTVLPSEYAILAVDRGNRRLWVDRGFSNPHGHLVDAPGPLVHRIPRILTDPGAAPYLLRMAVLRSVGVIIGSAGFHDRPDATGMIEIGLGIVPDWQGQGLATEMLAGMWGWVVRQPGVRVLRYTVAPDNLPSLALIAKFGGEYRGQQIDEEDGPEDIYELTADAFTLRWPADSSGVGSGLTARVPKASGDRSFRQHLQ
jgi:RimJ/RimL family protein N-acetyltransferase